MSWVEPSHSHELFAAAANVALPPLQPRPFTLEVWESKLGLPNGQWLQRPIDLEGLAAPCEMRIVLAPLDLPLPNFRANFLDLFRVLNIPSAFSTERVSSVSHSFAAIADAGGMSTWFHFLCKNITVSSDHGNPGVVYHAGADVTARRQFFTRSAHSIPLPQADYSYIRSGFFLRTTPGGTTLTCFGATPHVEGRLKRFIRHNVSHSNVISEPYVLLDIVLDGLFHDVDGNVWKMNEVFGALEHLTLTLAHSRREQRNIGRKMPFVELHNIAKHITHLGEAVESCLLLIEGIIAEIDSKNSSNSTVLESNGSASTSTTLTSTAISSQLRSSLSYRRSLFKSTELRLGSLSKRVDNAINLAFNMVTQQDSMVMIQDSSSMKIIATITLTFLPTATVAAIMGSQLFLSSVTGDDWLIQTSPLFQMMWSICIPLTLVVAALALTWYWWTHSEHQERIVAVMRGRSRGVNT